MVNKERYGVHQTHCCVMHGCKYGNSDCPVVTGEIIQEYPCEDCPSGYKPGMRVQMSIDNDNFTKLQENILSYYPFKVDEMNIAVGYTVVFTNKKKETLAKVISHIERNVQFMKKNVGIMSFYNSGNDRSDYY